ncbi:lateral signaling target protein 2 homolog [Macadamia integrifolia]|uniref:lateral signaling target protein 2 homolog n=1 Tax=Macadamia integrifolia TaxID=60698 RepID=UPI001C4F066B|nr:lateral signaling target protein 2 homolog [Macadamia integrifolia]XP_042507607.1 lateral signaling target protein 2 homolog [Macadamia integrifolia]
MARIAVTLTLIFSLFLLSHARIHPNEPENLLVEWDPSTSNEPKILLPSERPKEDAVLSEEVAEFESTGTELPESDDVATVGTPITSSETSISSMDEVDHHHHHHHKKHKKHCFHFQFKFPFLFHKHCHHHKNHTHCDHHKKNHSNSENEDKEMEKHLDSRIVSEEIPSGEDLIMARTAEFHHEDGEGMMKHHKKEWKKEKEGKMKKHHKKEWKKEKKDGGLMRFFRKLFKHFH